MRKRQIAVGLKIDVINKLEERNLKNSPALRDLIEKHIELIELMEDNKIDIELLKYICKLGIDKHLHRVRLEKAYT